MDIERHRELQVLQEIGENGRTSQRRLSSRLGIALGLMNLYMKRLVRKGYVKCVSVQRNRMRYLLTPRGVAEKTRLTYEYMEFSLQLYRETRQHLRSALQAVVRNGCQRVAIFGIGEPAELAYMSLKEFGLEPVAIFAGERNGSFLGMPVSPIADHTSFVYDMMIVATLDDPAPVVRKLIDIGVSEAKLCTLRPVPKRPERSNRRMRSNGTNGGTLAADH
jgi:DNA-binding MarR family transcriptional regulator